MIKKLLKPLYYKVEPFLIFLRAQTRFRRFFKLYRALIEVTTHCNLNCAGCTRTLKPRHMSYAYFVKVIDKLPKAMVIDLYGLGEPLVNPEIIRMVRYTKDSGKFDLINISTNALFNDTAIFDRLLENRLDDLIVSVDTFSQKETDKIRGGTDINLLRKNLKYLLDNYNDQVTPRITISKANLKSFDRTIREFDRMGAERVHIQPFFESWGGKKNALTKEDKRIFLKKIEKLKELKIKLLVGSLFFPPKRYCWTPSRNIYIFVNGDVGFCCITLSNPEMNFGNFLENPISQTFFSKRYSDILRNMARGNYPDCCKRCTNNPNFHTK